MNALRETALTRDPFPFLVMPNFFHTENLKAISDDFPAIEIPGSVPPQGLKIGPTFSRLLEELHGSELRSAISEKLNMDLEGRPTLITLRGKTRMKDGRIHTDTKSKLVTVLMYFNPTWEPDEGRLRVLRSNRLDDYVVEIPPTLGTCLIFKVTDNCWHGHKPFEGTRKAIQLNYLSDESALKKHLSKHSFSAKLKGLARWFREEDSYVE